MIEFNLGDLLVNPEPYVAATKLWLEDNAMLLGGCAVGALTVAGGASFGVEALMKEVRRRRRNARRFGGMKEARKADLLRNVSLRYSGIPIGRIGRKRLCWVAQEPLLVTGGTRSGKGVGVIRPACMTYGGPMVMYDGGKGELFRDTAGYRKLFSHVLNFDLTNPDGVCFNFLEEIDPANAVAGADNVVKAIPKPEQPDGHFDMAGDRLIGAVILHVLFAEVPEKKNLGEVVRIISSGDEGMRRIAAMNANETAVNRIRGLFNGDPFEVGDDGSKYRQSVYNSAVVRLAPFEDPIVAKVTSRSDFRLSDLIRLSPTKRPVSLHLNTPSSEDDRLRPVNSMFLSMLMSAIMRDQPAREKQPTTLFVIDEFPSLRMEILQTAITKIVGCGATMILGAQSLHALAQKPYGPHNQFRDNIRCHVAFAANDAHTQRDIAQSCGMMSETKTSHSQSRSAGSWWSGSKSETESEIDRPRMTAGDIREMDDEEELIFITGQRVIKANKIRDYKDKILKKRLNLPVPPLRGTDGVYPDPPCPEPVSQWAGYVVEEPAVTQVRGGDEAEAPPPRASRPRRQRSAGNTDGPPEAIVLAESQAIMVSSEGEGARPSPASRRGRRIVVAPETPEAAAE